MNLSPNPYDAASAVSSAGNAPALRRERPDSVALAYIDDEHNTNTPDMSERSSVGSVRMASFVQQTMDVPKTYDTATFVAARNIAGRQAGDSTSGSLAAGVRVATARTVSMNIAQGVTRDQPVAAAADMAVTKVLQKPAPLQTADSGNSLNSASSLQSSTADEAADANAPSIQRMQSFLGPKMKHISPAPWHETSAPSEDWAAGITSTFSRVNEQGLSTPAAEKSAPRSRSLRDLLGGMTVKSDVKGLGIAAPPSPSTPEPQLAASLPLNIAKEHENKTTKASSVYVPITGGARQTVAPLAMTKSSSTDSNSSINPRPRGSSKSAVAAVIEQPALTASVGPAPPTPPPAALLSPSMGATMTVTNIVRSRSPDPGLVPQISISALRDHKSSASTSGGNGAFAHSTATAPPAVAAVLRESSRREPSGDRKASAPRKRPPVIANESSTSLHSAISRESSSEGLSSDKASFSTSNTSVDASPEKSSATIPPMPALPIASNMRLISLDDAREREKERIRLASQNRSAGKSSTNSRSHNFAPQTIPSRSESPLPPVPPLPTAFSEPSIESEIMQSIPDKAVKPKKSAFLKLFKPREDLTTQKISAPTPMSAEEAALAASTGQRIRKTSASRDEGRPGRSRKASENSDVSSSKSNGRITPGLKVQGASPDISQSDIFTEQEAPAPSLSLRPVSMFFNKMPREYIAGADSSRHSSSRSEGARTPDTPSFVFFDTANSQAARTSPALSVNGLPTPPHSASMPGKTFTTQAHKQPLSPILLYESGIEATTAAAYRAKILDLEQKVLYLQKELASYKGEAFDESLLDGTPGNGANHTCGNCGCSCKSNTSQTSILQRSRAIVGDGNMFSSNRD